MSRNTPDVAFDIGRSGEQVASEVGWTVDLENTTGLRDALSESLEQSVPSKKQDNGG
jgi:hypothetical protein